MIRRLAHKHFLWWCGLILSAASIATGAERAQFQVKHWSTTQGLPQSRTACLKLTHDGYLWIGTWYGLVRFNGVGFTVFSQFNTPEMEDHTINSLDEDTEGTLWIGTRSGLLSYRDHVFHRFSQKDGIPDPNVWRVAASRSGGVWILSGNTVLRFEGSKKFRSYEFDKERNPIRAMQEDKDGWLSVITDHSWLKISPDSSQLLTNGVRAVSAGGWMTATLATHQPGCLWAGGFAGLERVTGNGSTHIPRSHEEESKIDMVYEDAAGNIWVGDRQGRLCVWDGDRWSFVNLGEETKSAVFTGMVEDREGSLWAGTTVGLLQIQKPRVRTFTTRDGLPDDFVYSVCEDAQGTIWAGTSHGVCRLVNDRVVPLGAMEPDVNWRDRCVCPNGKGGLWFAKEKLGLYEFQDGKFMAKAGEPLFFGPIGSLFSDRSNRLCVGSAKMVSTFDGEKITPLGPPFPLKNIRSILRDHEGSFWFGTKDHGVIRLRQNEFTRFTETNGLANNSVWSIHEDASGGLWFGTGNGLTRLKKGAFFSFTQRHGLINGSLSTPRQGSQRLQRPEPLVINCVLEDNLGYLWLSGLRGLSRIERTQLDAVAEKRAAEVECAIVDATDGMKSSETNGERQPAGWKAHDGRLWFPTIQGLIVVDPAKFETHPAPPPIEVEQIVADEEILYGDFAEDRASLKQNSLPGPGNKSLNQRLKPTQINLAAGRAKLVEFYFTANTLLNPNHARFRYRLSKNGQQSPWGAATTDRAARYTNLRPGNYAFEVTAADHNGIWNPTPDRFAFSLAPHFWETWPFIGLCACIAVGLAAMLQGYRLRWQRRLLKLDELSALGNERARIARDLHDDLGTELIGLALQLDVVEHATKAEPALTKRLGQAAKHTRAMAQRMREVVWSVNPKCDTLPSVAEFLEQQAAQFLNSDSIRMRLDFPEKIPPLSLGAEARHQLALSVREALTNVVRHAQATEVVLSLAVNNHQLIVQVKDNGRGVQNPLTNGHGLGNMKARLAQIGGTFDYTSAEGGGTVVSFRVPLPGHSQAGKSNL